MADRKEMKQQRVAAKQMYRTNAKSPTGPQPAPTHPLSVVPKEVASRGDAPSQGHRRCCLCIFVVWPCAWFLY